MLPRSAVVRQSRFGIARRRGVVARGVVAWARGGVSHGACSRRREAADGEVSTRTCC